jgi:hypothetical protein
MLAHLLEVGMIVLRPRRAVDLDPAPPAPRSILGRAAAWPPLRLGQAYAVTACAGAFLQAIGLAGGRRGLTAFGLLLTALAGLALYIVVAFYRDDDVLSAAVLFVVTLLVGTIAAGVVAGVVVTRSLAGGMAMLIMSPITYVVTGFVMIPVAAAIIWISRRVSRAVELVAGTRTPAPPATAPKQSS